MLLKCSNATPLKVDCLTYAKEVIWIIRAFQPEHPLATEFSQGYPEKPPAD